MKTKATIGKRDFIQYTSRYLTQALETGQIIITHNNKPCLIVKPIKQKTIKDIAGLIPKVNAKEDLNTPILDKEFEEWLS